MTTPISSGDPLVALAAMMIDRDNLRAAVDEEALRAAREEQHRALAREVNLLHEAADDMRTGALLEGGLTIAGGALAGVGGVVPACSHPVAHDFLTGSGAVARTLAGPMGKMLGDAPKADAEADAKQAEAQAADAGSRADEAERHRARIDQSADRVLDTIGATLASEAQGNLAIISNV